jgi:hypothetical protein
MTFWDLCPEWIYSLVGVNSGRFKFTAKQGQDRKDTIILLTRRRIPIKSWGWRLGFIKQKAMDGTEVPVMVWTFYVKKTQAHYAYSILQEKQYDILSAPRGAHIPPPRSSGAPKKRKRKKKPKWRM